MTEFNVHNSSDKILIISKNDHIKGVDGHTWEFVKQKLMENEGNSTKQDYYDLSQWHLEAKICKKMNDWSQKFKILQELTSEEEKKI